MKWKTKSKVVLTPAKSEVEPAASQPDQGVQDLLDTLKKNAATANEKEFNRILAFFPDKFKLVKEHEKLDEKYRYALHIRDASGWPRCIAVTAWENVDDLDAKLPYLIKEMKAYAKERGWSVKKQTLVDFNEKRLTNSTGPK